MLPLRTAFLFFFLPSTILGEIYKCDEYWDFFENSCYIIQSFRDPLPNMGDGVGVNERVDHDPQEVAAMCESRLNSELARVTSAHLNRKIVEWMDHSGIPCRRMDALTLYLPLIYADSESFRLKWAPGKYDNNQAVEIAYSNFKKEANVVFQQRRNYVNAVMNAKICERGDGAPGEWDFHRGATMFMCHINLTRAAESLPLMSDDKLETMVDNEPSYARRRLYFKERERRAHFRRHVKQGLLVIILSSCLLLVVTVLLYLYFHKNAKLLKEIDRAIRSLDLRFQTIAIDQKNLLCFLETIGMVYEEFDYEQRVVQSMAKRDEDLILSGMSFNSHSQPTHKDNDYSSPGKNAAKTGEKRPPKKIDPKRVKLWQKFKIKTQKPKAGLRAVDDSDESVNECELHADEEFIYVKQGNPDKDLFLAAPAQHLKSPPTPLDTAVSTGKSSNSAHQSATGTHTFSAPQQAMGTSVAPPQPPRQQRRDREKTSKTTCAVTASEPGQQNTNTTSPKGDRVMATQSMDEKSKSVSKSANKSGPKPWTLSTSAHRSGRK